MGKLKPKGLMAEWVMQPKGRRTDCSLMAEEQPAAERLKNRLQPHGRRTDGSLLAKNGLSPDG